MSTDNTNGIEVISAAPGHVVQVSGDLTLAREAANQAQVAVQLEQRRLAGVRGRSPLVIAEHERRLDDARRELDVAEAFEEALANGEL